MIIKSNEFTIPILFLIFNRPDTTNIVFEQIRKKQPKKLFIAADGPRSGHEDDVKNCVQARTIVDHIDWPCQVHTLFRDHNLGCGKAISQAISWFFENVEAGIILEDDCVPDSTFFDFCAVMIERYYHEYRVMMITGTSFLFNKVSYKESYFFSRYYSIWGWATWRRAWRLYDFELHDFNTYRIERIEQLNKIFDSKLIVRYWQENFDKIVEKKIDTWDTQWAYCCIFNSGFCITPINNLVSNIGYNGVHTKRKSHGHDISCKPIEATRLIHPTRICSQPRLDKKIYTNMCILPPVTIKNVIKKFFPCVVTIKQIINKIRQKNDLQNL